MREMIDGSLMDHLKHQLSNYATAYIELVDAHQHQAEEMQLITAKMADLEDRSRRNNLKIRGIPETVPPAELSSYLQQFFKLLVPSLTTLDFTIHRAHRIFKPAHIPA